MKNSHKILVIFATLIGLIALILAIIGIATRPWVTVQLPLDKIPDPPADIIPFIPILAALLQGKVPASKYSLFQRCVNGTNCRTVSTFKSAQGLSITGAVCLLFGVITAVITIFISFLRQIRLLSLVPLFFFIAGPILIIIGYLLHAEYLIKDFAGGISTEFKMQFGYSFILMVASSLLGIIAAVVAGITFGHGLVDHKAEA